MSVPRGFSLVELLVAMTVCALLSGAIAAIVPQARSAFEATPEVLDIQQRQRTVANVLTRALRSAADLNAQLPDGTHGPRARAVELLDLDDSGEWFHALRAIAIAGTGRGVIDADQATPSGPLRLQAAGCPATGDVCGFSVGSVAAVVDAGGRIDLFRIASTSAGANSIAPAVALSGVYAAGSAVYEVTADTYYLDEQPDGSFSLVRETAAGAIQPIVDDVPVLKFEAWRSDEVIRRLRITVAISRRSTTAGLRINDRGRQFSVALRNPS